MHSLERYQGRSSRYDCPGCGKRHEFTRYINNATGQHLHPAVGICNRVDKCGYHYTPQEYFRDHNVEPPSRELYLTYKPVPPKPASFMDREIMWKSVQSHAPNYFTQYLSMLVGAAEAQDLVLRYHVGTARHWNGATVFWQVDTKGRVRGGKVMLYNPLTGKRVKEPYNHISWVHSVLRLKGFNLSQCLFGEHLLERHPSRPVALVESEKTAVIASHFLPDYTWLAVGGKLGLKADRLQVLKGREVTLFPDLQGFDLWDAKARELSWLARFTVSDVLERIATPEEREQGLDLADYLVRGDLVF